MLPSRSVTDESAVCLARAAVNIHTMAHPHSVIDWNRVISSMSYLLMFIQRVTLVTKPSPAIANPSRG